MSHTVREAVGLAENLVKQGAKQHEQKAENDVSAALQLEVSETLSVIGTLEKTCSAELMKRLSLTRARAEAEFT